MAQRRMSSQQAVVTAEGAQPAENGVAITRSILYDVFGPPERRDFAVRLWDGSEEGPAGGARRFTLVIQRPGALRRVLLPPSELGLGEAYLRDDFDIGGDIEAAAGLADTVAAHLGSPAALGSTTITHDAV